MPFPLSFSPRVISVAPRLTHLLRPVGVAAVVVPAHELHARAVQPLLAAEIQVPRLARPGGDKMYYVESHVPTMTKNVDFNTIDSMISK